MLKKYFIVAIAAGLAMVACSEKFDEPGIQPAGSDNVHTLSVGIEAGTYTPAEGGTKASMEAVIRVNWTAGDEVSVVNATQRKILGGCLKAKETGVSVTFEGTVTGTINPNDKLYYIYPRIAQNESAEDFDNSGYGVSLAEQTYDSNNSSKVCFYGYADDVAGTATATISKKIQFHLVTSYVHLNMANLPAKGFALSSIDISKINKGFKWSLSDSGELTADAYGENEGISVNCSNCKITQAGNAVVRFAIPASAATGSESRVVTVNKAYTNDKYVKDKLIPSAYYNQLYTSWESNVSVSDAGDKTEVTLTNEGSSDVAEGVLPVEEAFVKDKPTEIGIGGVGTITFNETATSNIKTNASGSTEVFFKIEDVTETKPVQEANLVYEVTMKTVDQNGTEVFSESNAGKGSRATITIELGQSVQSVQSVSLVDENGAPVSGNAVDNLHFDPETGRLTFDVLHFSRYAIKYTTKETPESDYVAQIGNRKYMSFASALAAVQNGQTIVMLKNDVLTKGQTITFKNNESFTLDLNGQTISIAETEFDFTANGTNSANGSIPARFAIVVKGNGAMNICDNSTDKLGRLETKDYNYKTTKTILVVEDAIVNVTSGTIAADYAAFYVVGYTGTGETIPAGSSIPSLNISGGKVVGQQIGIALKGKTATVNITGGEIVGTKTYGVSTNGTTDWYDGGHCRINISGGTIKSENGLAMYLPAEAITEITGGTIEGSTGIGVKGGSLSISGDAVVKAVGQHKEDAHAESNGCSETGSCIYVEDTYENHSPRVNISGGKFSSTNFKSVEYFTNKTTEATNKGKITLTGGIYSDAPDASFTAEGYAVVSNEDDVTKADYPHKVAIEDYWPNFAASAFSSLNEGGKTLTISTPEELALLAKNINKGTSYAGYTITISGNLDMSAHYWIPINAYSSGSLSGATIQGTNDAVISNLKIKNSVSTGSYNYYSGFIGQVGGELTFKNLTFSGADVTVGHGSGIAVVLGQTYSNALFDNVKVVNSTVSSNTKVGALVGFTGGNNEKITVNNCAIENVTVNAAYSYAIMVGLINVRDQVVFEGNNVVDANSHAVYDAVAGAVEGVNETVEIKGYTYCVAGSDLWVTGVKDAWAEVRSNPQPTMTIDNKEYKINGDTFYHANGVVVNVCAPDPVVEISGVKYTDIADAFAAVPTDGTPTTVTLLENIGSKNGNEIVWKEYAKTSVYKIKDGQNITFDLNGHKIYAKTTVTGYTCFFEVANGGSLTFMDSAGGGELHYLDGMDNTGGLAIISYGTLIMQSGTVENHTKCNSSAIQGAIDVRANEWGAQYQYHSVFTMNGGVLKSNGDNTLRIYDSSQTGTGSVVVDFTINGGEVYGADAIFIQPQWTKTYSANGIYMNNFNISVTGGKFDTNNGIRVYGAVNETNNQTYRAIQISVTGGEFTIRKPSDKYRDGHIAYQNNGTTTDEATEFLRSYTEVHWTAADPKYCQE